MDPGRVSVELDRLYDELTTQVETYAKLAEEAADAEAEYKMGYAKALRQSEGTSQDRREADATVLTGDALFVRRLAEARLAAQKERLASLRTQADMLRTLSADMRSVS